MSSKAEPAPISSAELLKERQRLEKLYKEKYTRKITVMFTDLKDSTALAETEGDIVTRELLERHNDIVFSAIKAHQGNLVKTIGDGTMSYFEQAQQALRAAAQIQASLKDYNAQSDIKTPILVRVGINTGVGIVEETDIYGDVVNVAARFEAQAGASEIYMSESTYEALENKGEFYSRIIKKARLKGKRKAVQIYKVFWDPVEVEHDKEYLQQAPSKASHYHLTFKACLRLSVFVGILLAFVFAVMHLSEYLQQQPQEQETRTRQHQVSIVSTLPPPDIPSSHSG